MVDETGSYSERFAGIARLYGESATPVLKSLHVCVVGLGGVGSWVVEALARTGVGRLTLIDYDDIALSNINRQVHTLSSSVGVKKSFALKQRVEEINPECRCEVIDDYINQQNHSEYLAKEKGFDYVVDAIDSIKFKALMIYYCKRNKIPIITTGGAGGLSDPTQIDIVDLSKTFNDPLAAKVRSQLRQQYGFSKNVKRRFGIDCVFSKQQQVYPQSDGSVGPAKPGIHGVSLDCRFGYGAVTMVTATFGFAVAARVIDKSLRKALENND